MTMTAFHSREYHAEFVDEDTHSNFTYSYLHTLLHTSDSEAIAQHEQYLEIQGCSFRTVVMIMT